LIAIEEQCAAPGVALRAVAQIERSRLDVDFLRIIEPRRLRHQAEYILRMVAIVGIARI
jgi:hypothetical protein